MILKTIARNYNKPIMISIDGLNHELKFNISGEVEIKDNKLAKAITDKYPNYIWEKGSDIEVPKTKEEKITEEYVNELKDEISKLETSLKNKKEEIEVLEEDLKVWKNKTQELLDGKSEDENKLTEELNSYIELNKKLTLEVNMWKSSVKELQKLCKELGCKKEEYEKLTAKEDLIEFILTKG